MTFCSPCVCFTHCANRTSHREQVKLKHFTDAKCQNTADIIPRSHAPKTINRSWAIAWTNVLYNHIKFGNNRPSNTRGNREMPSGTLTSFSGHVTGNRKIKDWTIVGTHVYHPLKSQKVDAATSCSGVCPHTWPDLRPKDSGEALRFWVLRSTTWTLKCLLEPLVIRKLAIAR